MSSFAQLDKDFSNLTRDIAGQDAAMEKLRPLLDAEMSRSILLKLGDAGADENRMRITLTELEFSMKGICSTLLDIQDGMQSKSYETPRKRN